MICHYYGEIYIEFFTNAKQEHLFIDIIRGFYMMNVFICILTDNMKSVVNKRATDGIPPWQKEYEQFMSTLNFRTTLCKPRHPYTKSEVERFVRFVKDNFLPGRSFTDLTVLNNQAAKRCFQKNNTFKKISDGLLPKGMRQHVCSMLSQYRIALSYIIT